MAGRSTLSVRLVHTVAVVSIIIILISTLSPFDFGVTSEVLATKSYQAFELPTDARDWILNTLLFTPLALAVTLLIGQGQPRTGWRVLVTVLAICAALSATVEFLQLFLPARQPSIGDVLSNIFGAGLGYLVAHLIGASVFLMPIAQLSTRSLSIAATAYIILVVLTVAFLQQETMLSDWEPSYPLVLGNEPTGDRSWLGNVWEVSLADQAISQADVARTFANKSLYPAVEAGALVSYDLSAPGNYSDRSGRLPDLQWQGQSSIHESRGVQLTANGWLITNGPAAAISESIAKSSSFTLSAVVATNKVDQSGPARIVSLSKDTFYRNLTLGQEGTDMILRVRTRLTGINGSRGEIALPNIFNDKGIHQIVIVYKRPNFKFFIDDIEKQYSLRLSPDLTLFGSLLSFNPQFRVGSIASSIYIALFYGAVFLPLGYLLALIAMKQRARPFVSVSVVCAGLIVSVAVVEVLLSAGEDRALSSQIMLLSVAVMAIPLVAVYARSRGGRKSAAPR